MSWRKIASAVLIANAALAVTAVVSATAPEDQYLGFTSQNIVIVDQKTTLEWERNSVSVSNLLNAGGAVAHCGSFSAGDAGGGWRVPTVKELLTLVDEQTAQVYDQDAAAVVVKAIDTSAFPRTAASKYFTVTPHPSGGANVFCVDFATGQTLSCGAGEAAQVRCVR